MSGPTIDAETRRFIDEQRVGRLATAGADGAPHVVPVVFALVDDDAYVVIDEKPKTTLRLRRLRNIAENPRAALLVDVYDEDWSRLRWAMLRGAASVLAPGPGAGGGGRGAADALRAVRLDGAGRSARHPAAGRAGVGLARRRRPGRGRDGGGPRA